MFLWHLMNLGYNELMRYLLLLTLIWVPLNALASPAEEPKDDSIPILDTAQELLGARANFAANRFDSFFATERADDEFGRSRIRVRSRFNLRERAKSDLDNQYRVNLKLPNLEDKFRFSYLQGDKDKKKKKKEQKELEAAMTDTEKAARLERQRLKDKDLFEGWLFNADIGVSAAIPPKLITRARVRKNLVTGTFIHRFSEQLTYVTDEDGLTEETELNSDHPLGQDVLFRFINYKRWRVLKKDFITNHGPTILHQVTENDAFSYNALMSSTITDSVWYVSNYQLAVNYRRNLYRQWVYLDVIPGIDFPKEWSFRRTPFIIFQIEFLFGSS